MKVKYGENDSHRVTTESRKVAEEIGGPGKLQEGVGRKRVFLPVRVMLETH